MAFGISKDVTDDGFVRKPGTYYVQIRNAEEKSSSKGDPMLKLELFRVGGGKLCYENLMGEGAGASIAIRKLKVLGLDPRIEPIETASLIGRKLWVVCKESQRCDKQGNPWLEVDLRAGENCGWYSEANPPTGAAPDVQPEEKSLLDKMVDGMVTEAPDDDSKTPF